MLPEITIFNRTFPMYGLMGALGFLLGLLFICIRGKRTRNPLTDDAVYIFTFGGIGMLIGAKVLYILTVFPQFLKDLPVLFIHPAAFLYVWLSGGMVFYGGLAGAVIGAWITARIYHHRFSDYYDLIVPPVALAAGFGRIGCLCEGCCYGKPTSLPIGITFTHSPVAPDGIPLFPTQLLEALFDFMLSACLAFVTRDHNDRQILEKYILIYSIWRFFIEFERGDLIRGIHAGLSISQWISMALILFILLSYAMHMLHRKETS